MGHSDGDLPPPAWHGFFNMATFYGGWLLLVALVFAALARRSR